MTVENGATPLLEAADLAKSYRLGGIHRGERLHVLRGISLVVYPGEWVALCGPSGCGKSTLLYVLGTLDRPDSGSLRFAGRDVRGMGFLARARLRRERIGFVFQNYQLLPELTALDNVMLAGRLLGRARRVCRERAEKLLERVGLAARWRHLPAELSGGEQQRVALARALMNDPELILADEPTGNLDPANSEAIMNLLHELRAKDGRSIVTVTHAQTVAGHADRIYDLAAGKLRRHHAR